MPPSDPATNNLRPNINRFPKPLLWAMILIPCLCLIAGYTAMDSIFGGMCGNKITNELISPNGDLKAITFTRDCGATTDYSTQVSIIGARDELPNDAGNVFVASDQIATRIKWLDNESLFITHDPSDKVLHKKRSHSIFAFPFFKNVAVQYQSEAIQD